MNICALLAVALPEGLKTGHKAAELYANAEQLLKLNRTGRFEMTELCGWPRHYHS